MKITKIISMVLVFAMMFTMFASVSVFAEDKANIVYKVYDESGKEVEGNLVADTVYELSIQFTDIPSKTFKGAEVKTTFDPEVIKLVNKANGNDAGTAAQALINTLEMYDADTGEGYFKTAALSKGDDFIVYNVSLTNDDGGDILAEYPDGYPNDGAVELCRIKVKTLKNGSAKIATIDEDIKFYATSEKEAVTIVPNSIRVGDVAYVAAEVDETFVAAEKYVLGETTKDAVLADLAAKYAKVKVTFTDEEDVASDPVDCAITWKAADNFDASKADTYTFTGAVDTTAVNYTGDAVQVTATVTVEPLTVEAITALDDVELRQNVDTYELPAEVEVTVTGGKKAMLPATWSPDAVANTDAGTTTYTATITGTADITVPEDKNTVSFDVTVFAQSVTTAPEASAIDEVILNSNIGAEVILLPDFVTLADGYIDVDEWTIKTVNGEAAPVDYVPAIGDVITYAPVFAEGFTAPADFVATVTVVVPDGKKEITFNKTEFETDEIKSDADYSIEDAIEASGIVGTYTDGTEVTAEDITWAEDTVPAYDNEVAGEYVLTGTWADIYGHEEEFEITINIVPAGATGLKFVSAPNATREITSITMGTGENKTIYVSLEPVDADDKVVEWKSSNTNRVTVKAISDKAARITTKFVGGKVTITATTGSGVSKNLTVIVQESSANGNGGNYYYTSNNGSGSGILAQAAEEAAGQNAAQNSVFGDLAGYEWAATQIDTLRLLGIVSGKSATTYAPADSVTRAEYLAMLVRLLNLQANGEAKTFTDVNPGDWFYDTVNVASSLGIAYGYENGAFDPNAVIKRQDMAVFAKRALDVAGISPVVGISSTFEDQADIDAYALDAVLYMTSVGVINGMGDGTFKPLETANRAQAAVVIYNIYTIKNK